MRGKAPVNYATHSYIICHSLPLPVWLLSPILICTSVCSKCESLNGASKDSILEDFTKFAKYLMQPNALIIMLLLFRSKRLFTSFVL